MQMPCQLIAGQSPGISTSSFETLGPIFSASTLGQAKTQTVANVSSGNLFVTSLAQTVEVPGFRLNVGMVYNSETGWRLNVEKSVKLTGQKNQANSSIEVTQNDGGVITFAYDEKTESYLAKDQVDGAQQITIGNDGYVLTQLKTGLVETFSSNGLQVTSTDSSGNCLNFLRDEQQRLKQIQTNHQQQINFNWSNQQLAINYSDNQQQQNLLQYQFDETGRVTQASVGLSETQNYQINYQYDPESGCLSDMQQSDGSRQSFAYDNEKRFKQLTTGTGEVYQLTGVGTNQVEWVTPSKQTTTLTLDNEKRVTQITRPVGDEKTQSQSQSQSFTYLNNSQLVTSKVDSDTAKTIYAFDDSGNLIQTTNALGDIQSSVRDPETGVMTSQTQVLKTQTGQENQTTWFVVNPKRQVLFQVRQNGEVRQNSYDGQGNLISQRIFNQSAYPTKNLTPQTVLSSEALNQWVNQQDLSQSQLTTWTYNENGQKESEIKANSNNSPLSQIQKTAWQRNLAGQVLLETQLIGQNLQKTTTQSFDGMHRLLQTQSGDRQTNYQYLDQNSQVVKTTSLGLTETKTCNQSGEVTSITSEDQASPGKTRYETISRDLKNQVKTITNPLSNINHYEVYDDQNRLAFQIDARGQVTGFTYNCRNQRVNTTRYDAILDVNELKPLSFDTVRKSVNDQDPKNRLQTNLYDQACQLRYQIDPRGSVTEFRYDSVGNQTAKLQYANFLPMSLPPENNRVLDENGNLAIAESADDRQSHYFYDQNNRLLAKQDGSGFVTTYSRNLAGEVQEKTRYATPTPISDDLVKVMPTPNPEKDSSNLYFYDSVGKVIGEVNGENYLTIYQRNGLGQITQTTQFSVPVNPQPNQSLTDLMPKTDPNPHVIKYTYNELGQKTRQVALPSFQITEYAYDQAGHLIGESTYDGKAPNNTQNYRTTRYLYNAFGQKIATLSERACQLQGVIFNTPLANNANNWQQGEQHDYNYAGLCTKTTNALGQATIYFYNENDQIEYTINAKGGVTQTIYNAFDEKIQSITYIKALSENNFSQLVGGYTRLSPIANLVSQIKDPNNDLISKAHYDLSGNQTVKQAPQGFIETKQYNAFGEVKTQTQQIDSQQSLNQTTDFVYNHRGEVIEKTEAPNSLKLTTQLHYNFLGKCRSVIDPRGNITWRAYDKLGRKTSELPPNVPPSQPIKISFDAFNRQVSYTDCNEHTQTTTYQDQQRQIIQTNANGIQVVLSQNAFSETIRTQNNLQEITQITYGVDGQIDSETNPLQQTTSYQYALNGDKVSTTHPNQSETALTYDEIGLLKQTTQDVKQQALMTKHDYDGANRDTSTTYANNVTELTSYQNFGQSQTELKNLGGNQLKTTTTYNGLKKPIQTVETDSGETNRRETSFVYDEIGRETTKTIDPKTDKNPNGLNLQTKKTYDGNDNLLSETDANGNVTRSIFDERNNPVYTIDGNGFVVAYQYDFSVPGKVLFENAFNKALSQQQLAQINDQTTPSQIAQILQNQATPQDHHTWQRYRKDGQLQYTVNRKGIVIETLYDSAGKKAGEKKYAKPIDTQKLTSWDPSQITEQVEKQLSPDDRLELTLCNALQKPRFAIKANGIVTEYRYNLQNQVCAEILYANPIDMQKLEQLNSFTTEAFKTSKLLQPNSQKDEWRYNVHNDLGELRFHIDAKGMVTEYRYDERGNCTDTLVYVQSIQISPGSQPTVSDIEKILSSNKTAIKRHSQKVYDNAQRLIQENQLINEKISFSDVYTLDALGGCTKHVDKVGQVHRANFDHAGRSIWEYSPPFTQTFVQVNENGSLSYQQGKGQLVTEKQYDGVGHITKISKSNLLGTKKSVDFAYDKNNQRIQNQIDGVHVDDPSVTTPTPKVRPETQKNLSQTTTYDGFGKLFMTQDFSGNKSYQLRDAVGDLVYQIDQDLYVTAYEYNAFHEKINVTRYATALKALPETITPETIQSAVVASGFDRHLTILRDQAGRKMATLGDVDLVAKTNETGTVETANLAPSTVWQRNSSGKMIAENRLVFTNEWTKAYTWYDQTGHVIAKTNREGKVELYQRDGDGKVTLQYEYATPVNPSQLIDPVSNQRISLDDLKKLLINSIDDRLTTKTYDSQGLLQTETQYNIDQDQVSIGENGKPEIKLGKVTQTTSYKRDGLGRIIETTHPDGEKTYQGYHPNGSKAYHIGKPRQIQVPSKTPKNQKQNQNQKQTTPKTQTVTVYPITYYEMDGFGKLCVTIETFSTKPQATPNYQAQSFDKVTIVQNDKRGLVITKQNPNGAVSYYTYHATHTDKPARKYHWETQWQQTKANEKTEMQQVQVLRQTCIHLDPKGQVVQSLLRLDDGSDEITTYTYNSFGKKTSLGDGKQTIQWWNYNIHGQVLMDNAKSNQDELKLYDASGNQQVIIRSPMYDLSVLQSKQTIPQLLAMDFTQRQLTALVTDNEGRVKAQFKPSFYRLKPGMFLPLNTSFAVGKSHPEFGEYSISFPAFQEAFYEAFLGITPTFGDNRTPIELYLKTINGRIGADVTGFVTGYYDYALMFTYRDPKTGKLNGDMRYLATGRAPVATGNLKGCTQLVLLPQNQGKLYFTGVIDNLYGVQFEQDGKVIIKYGINSTDDPTIKCIDGTRLPTGEYTVKPINSYTPLGKPIKIGQTSETGFSLAESQLYLSLSPVYHPHNWPVLKGYWVNWYNLPSFIDKLELQLIVANSNGSTTFHDQWWNNIQLPVQGDHIYFISRDYFYPGTGPDNAGPITFNFYGVDKSGLQFYLGSAGRPWQGYVPSAKYSRLITTASNINEQPYDLITLENNQIQNYYPLYDWFTDTRTSDVTTQKPNWTSETEFQAIQLGSPSSTISFPVHLQTPYPPAQQMVIRHFQDADFFFGYVALKSSLANTGGNYNANLFIGSDMELDFINQSLAMNLHMTHQNQSKPMPYEFGNLNLIEYDTLMTQWNQLEPVDVFPVPPTIPIPKDKKYYLSAGGNPSNFIWYCENYFDQGFGVNAIDLSVKYGEERVPVCVQMLPYDTLTQHFEYSRPWLFNERETIWWNVTTQHYHYSTLYFANLPEGITSVEFQYFDTNLGLYPQWANLPVNITKFGFTINVLDIPSGQYAYRFQAFKGNVLLDLSEITTVNEAGFAVGEMSFSNQEDYIVTPSNKDAYEKVTPSRSQVHDAFGNVIQTTDELGAVTDISYTKFNQIRSTQKPLIDVVLPNNQIVSQRPTETRAYDVNRKVSGHINANGFPRIFIRNSCGDLVQSVLPSGSFQLYGLDGFGRAIQTTDNIGFSFENTYDKENNITSKTSPGNEPNTFAITQYEYNEAKQRTKTTTPTGLISYESFDARGDVLQSFTPTGQVITTTRNRFKEPVMMDDQVGPKVTWQMDPCGNITSFTDKSGQVITYTRDFNQLVIKEIGTGGERLPWVNYQGNLVPVPNINLTHIRNEVGCEAILLDNAQGLTTYYENDEKYRYIREYFVYTDGELYQDCRIERNACGWVIRAYDVSFEGRFGFDLNGNHRFHQVWFLDPNNPGHYFTRENNVENNVGWLSSSQNNVGWLSAQHVSQQPVGLREQRSLIQPTFELKNFKNEVVENFVLQKSLKNADGFAALGTTRSEFTFTLISLFENKNARALLKFEIKTAFQQNLCKVPKQFQKLQQDEKEAKQHFKQLKQQLENRFPQLKNLTPDQTFIWLMLSKEFEAASSYGLAFLIKKIATEMIDDYCQREDVFVYYLLQYEKGMGLGMQSAKLFAEQKNIRLRVFQKVENENRIELFEVNMPQPELITETVDLLFEHSNVGWLKPLQRVSQQSVGLREQSSLIQPTFNNAKSSLKTDVGQQPTFNASQQNQPGKVLTDEGWYFDNEDGLVIYNNVSLGKNNEIVLKNVPNSVQITYLPNNWRASQTLYVQNKIETQAIQYDESGMLKSVGTQDSFGYNNDGQQTTSDTFTITMSSDYNPKHYTSNTSETTRTIDKNTGIATQIDTHSKGTSYDNSGSHDYDTHNTTTYPTYQIDGTPLSEISHTSFSGGWYQDNVNFLYGGFGTSMVLVSVTGKRTRNDGDGYRVGTTQRTFDPNGNVRSQSGTSDFTMRYFIYNPEGRIVLKMSFGEYNPMHDLSVNGINQNVGWLSAQHVSQQAVGLGEQRSLIQPTFNPVKSTLKTDVSQQNQSSMHNVDLLDESNSHVGWLSSSQNNVSWLSQSKGNVGWLKHHREMSVSQQPVGLGEQRSLIQPTFNTSQRNQLSVEDENGTPLKKIPTETQVGKVIYIAEPKTGNILGSYGNIGPNGEPLQEVFADFSLDKQKVGPNYPPSSPGYYITQSNQSLQAISMQVYGTSTMAEVLARANGLEQNAQLTAGFRLKIPNLIAEDRNWQGDFSAYDPSQIIGGYMPYIPMPPLKPPHESFWHIVIDAAIFAVGAAIAVVTGGGAAPLVAVLDGLIIGAMTGMVEQEFNHVVFHEQFSWKVVLITAISMAVTSGVSSYFGAGALTLEQSVEESVEDSVITRMVEDALDLNHGFSWQDLVIAAFNGVVAHGDGELTNGMSRLTQEYINDGVEDTSDMILEDLTEGQHINNVSVEMLTAQLLGTAIGQGIGSQIKFKAQQKSQAPLQKQNVTRGNNHFPGAGHTVPEPQRNEQQLKNEQVKRYTEYHSQAKTDIKQKQQNQVAQQNSKPSQGYGKLLKLLGEDLYVLSHPESLLPISETNENFSRKAVIGNKPHQESPSWQGIKGGLEALGGGALILGGSLLDEIGVGEAMQEIGGKLVESGVKDEVGVVKEETKPLELQSQKLIRSRVLSNIEQSRIARESSNFEIHTILEKIPRLNIFTENNQSVFWSGDGNESLASDFAKSNAKLTLELTPGGKYLTSLKLFDRYTPDKAIIPWERLSARFAENVSGDVSVFVDGARTNGVFNRIELPILKNNSNVTNIIYSPEIKNLNQFNI